MNMNPCQIDLCQDRRRQLILSSVAAAFGVGICASLQAQALVAPTSPFPFGPVSPVRPVPPWLVVTEQSKRTDLAAMLRGQVTALQLMFTGCSATCPIQGALFSQAQQAAGALPSKPQFVSISIDPLSDSPTALSSWLRKFGAMPGWSAVAPRPEDVESIFALLGEGGERKPSSGSDRHTGQVYLINRRGELVWRTPSLPPASKIVAMLRALAEQA